MKYSAVDDVHRGYMQWIMIQVGEHWYTVHVPEDSRVSGRNMSVVAV